MQNSRTIEYKYNDQWYVIVFHGQSGRTITNLDSPTIPVSSWVQDSRDIAKSFGFDIPVAYGSFGYEAARIDSMVSEKITIQEMEKAND